MSAPPSVAPDPGLSGGFGPSYPFGPNYRGQGPVFGERYYAPQAPRPYWVPGYWVRQWVPRYRYYDVWVPAYQAPDGTWVEGHYETQAVQFGGQYQRVWVDGYWAQ
jgi:hypothetical protein